jgi:hypothetical protein
MSSECARHPGVAAVDICSRCGTFVCGDCVEYQGDDVPFCQPCIALVRVVPASMRSRLTVAAAAPALAILIAGFLVKGRPGIWLWAVSSVLGIVGSISAALEWRRLRNIGGVQRSWRWVRAALVLSALSLVGFLFLAWGFALFISQPH